jgi:hypothetical protein
MAHVYQALPLPQAAAALEHIAGFIALHGNWPLNCRDDSAFETGSIRPVEVTS